MRLRSRLACTTVASLSIGRLADDHFTAVTFDVGSRALNFGDSLHGRTPEGLGNLISRSLSTASLPVPSVIECGDVALQGVDGGEGSCAQAALNHIRKTLDIDTPTWIPSKSSQFRDIDLIDLLRFHLIAKRRVDEGEDFLDWVRPASEEVASVIEATANMGGHGREWEYMGCGYRDFNLYTPLVRLDVYSHLT
ncbi:hypothetical protein FA13DRAFT_1648712 [Coprinellus micaceus]|uniref:Uncharacterized protein n=1 Tax=Coprinellus micaceus TaxID=71717 RepID=A0A4Y7SC86_COPMI|nr:hypothetical protein FA13DRAFT_1648712 [Coprinellus micaceus]